MIDRYHAKLTRCRTKLGIKIPKIFEHKLSITHPPIIIQPKTSLCFTTCFDNNFVEGGKKLIQSIRKFYTPDEAHIVVFLTQPISIFPSFADKYSVTEIQYANNIYSWCHKHFNSIRYQNDTTHYYHPNFIPPLKLETKKPLDVGFHKIRHLHPLNMKAYCTGYCLVEKNYQKVIHIDADAFLLSKIDNIFKNSQPNQVIGFDDRYSGWAENFKLLYGLSPPEDINQYSFNAGIVIYQNGLGVRRLATDFMWYVESCHHFTHSGLKDQGIIQSLVAKYHLLKEINYIILDGINWNPTWNRADNLEERGGEWFNRQNNKKQYIWHGAGSSKLWLGDYPSKSVNAAWRWLLND